MSHPSSPIDPIEIRIRGNPIHGKPELDAYVRRLTASEQATLPLRTLLSAYCAERRIDARKYSLALLHDVLPATATVDTLSAAYNIPRVGNLTVTLHATHCRQPDTASESQHVAKRMSHMSLYDTAVAHDVLTRRGYAIDHPTLTGVVSATEKRIGQPQYRMLSERLRHRHIVDALHSSGLLSRV
jgi:hypothetical protein